MGAAAAVRRTPTTGPRRLVTGFFRDKPAQRTVAVRRAAAGLALLLLVALGLPLAPGPDGFVGLLKGFADPVTFRWFYSAANQPEAGAAAAALAFGTAPTRRLGGTGGPSRFPSVNGFLAWQTEELGQLMAAEERARTAEDPLTALAWSRVAERVRQHRGLLVALGQWSWGIAANVLSSEEEMLRSLTEGPEAVAGRLAVHYCFWPRRSAQPDPAKARLQWEVEDLGGLTLALLRRAADIPDFVSPADYWSAVETKSGGALNPALVHRALLACEMFRVLVDLHGGVEDLPAFLERELPSLRRELEKVAQLFGGHFLSGLCAHPTAHAPPHPPPRGTFGIWGALLSQPPTPSHPPSIPHPLGIWATGVFGAV